MTKESMYDLLSKYLAGDISAEERRILFYQLKENEELRKEAAGIQNLSVLISMANEDGAASDRQYRLFVGMRKKRALLFSLVRYQEFSTPAGQRAKVLLADGTEVWLNANTILRYPERFDPKKREVELHGEAFFEVEKAAGNPFVVKTNKMDIQVTGTKFNVNAYDTEEYFVASLVEGSVSVSCVHNRNSSYALQPRQQIVVSEHSSNSRILILWHGRRVSLSLTICC